MTVHGARTLDGFADQAGCQDGLRVTSLAPGTVVHVETLRSSYRLVRLDDPNQVLLSGGKFPDPVQATVIGATATGTMLKIGWIGIGLRLEIMVGGHRFTTSPVMSVTGDCETFALSTSRN